MIVEVAYETSPSATALQWLMPEQTAGKRAPYLFSQCQVTALPPPLLSQGFGFFCKKRLPVASRVSPQEV